MLRSAFGETAPLSPDGANAGLNGDGSVTLSDFSLFRAMFVQAPGP